MLRTLTPDPTITDHELLAGGWLAHISRRLIATMQDEGVDDPLSAPVTLAAVLHDLFSLAGASVPTEIQAYIG